MGVISTLYRHFQLYHTAKARGMKEVLKNLDQGQSVILTAPPGWGKTYRLLQAIQETQIEVLFIFPLRALCEEIYLECMERGISAFCMNQSREFASARNFQVILATPEVLSTCEPEQRICIFDECHLFFYWGETFREKMLFATEQVLASAPGCLFLTATLSQQVLAKWTSFLENNYSEIYKLDFGNQQLKNYPKQVVYFPKLLRKWLWDTVFFEKNKKCTLIFCQYRQQVKKLSTELRERNFLVLDCVGGEAREFTAKLSHLKRAPDFIVATSVVSHGVNLPALTKVIITYKVENLDFYLQMVGRGGRDGSDFELFTCNFSYFTWGTFVKGWIGLIGKRFSHKYQTLLYYLYEA